MADYIKELPETTSFLFIENEVDKRSKLYKAVKAKGRAVELAFQDEATLKRWIAGNVKKENKQITEQTIVYFLDKTGTNMENITKELEKLFCCAHDRDVLTKEDVDAVCVTQISNHIFEMVDAMAQKKQRKALELYYDLLALKEPPMRILFMMIRQYRILLQVKGLLKVGNGRKEIASKAGIPLWRGSIWSRQSIFRQRLLGRFWRTAQRWNNVSRQGGLRINWQWSCFL